jgi:DNA helicase-2/ATP-dependent DNA helicase PcrA
VNVVKGGREDRTTGSTDGFGHEPLAIHEGDTVHHDRWGEGVVVAVSGTGQRAEATIAFRDVGEKRLLLAYAPLAKQ